MTTTVLGKVMLLPRGDYSPSATYNFLDLLTYEGSSFVALKTVTGVTPIDDGVSYQLSASKGDTGDVTPEAQAAAAAALASQDDAAGSASDSATSAAAAAAASDAAQLSAGIYTTTAKALSNGVKSLTSLVGGSGGTNGTFALAFSGGAGSGASGTFTVAGGAVVSTSINASGDSYTSAPTVSFAASSGLTGASATAVISANVPSTKYFSIPSVSVNGYLDLYLNNAGAAVFQKTYPSSLAVQQPLWAGKLSGWPDPFFRHSTPGVSFLSRTRWLASGTPSDFSNFILVPNASFDGNAIRKTTAGTTSLPAMFVYLDEMGASSGDTVTLNMLVVGTGGTVNFPMICEASNGTTVGTQQLGNTVVSSATPQLVTCTFTVPAGAPARIRVYPYTSTGTFDIVAFWGGKGAASDIPTWPIYDDSAYTSPTLAALSATQSTLVTTVADNTARGAYTLDYVETVGYASKTTPIPAASLVASPRDVPFSGWGQRFTPAGVSFNAILLGTLMRTPNPLASSKWTHINCVVRTGASSDGASAPIVAVGSVAVQESLDTLSNVYVILRDPVTNNPITLTDASFSGGEYFIGVYATNSTGGLAACGDLSGTMSNQLSTRYYISGGSPTTAAWSLATGAATYMGYQHLLLVSPTQTAGYAPTQGFANALPVPSPVPPIIVMPKNIFGVQGRECNIYTDNLTSARDSDNLWDFNTSPLLGQQQSERFNWTPAGAASGTVTVTASDRVSGLQLFTATAGLLSSVSSAGTGLTKKVMVIGDSLVAAGVITQTLLDIASTDVMGVTLYGTQGAAPDKHEGRGGWTVSDYTTVGRTFYSFTVSGVTVAPQINSTQYTNNGNTYLVQTVNLSGGAGTIVCSIVSGGAPTASGTLTKTGAGTGDATIAFSASATAPGNPFWISGAVNFGQYLTNNSYPAMDWVFIALGINDIFGQTDDTAASSLADLIFTNLDLLIASIQASDAGTKVGLLIPTPPSYSQDSFGFSYGTGQTRWRYKRNILIWARQLIAKYAGQEASRIYIVPSNTALDTVNNMQFGAAAPVNSRNTAVTIARQNNGVHPGVPGYQQIADSVWAFLKYYA